jgi:predicted Fe-Mo cluster-binding NifX family protein
MKVAVSVNAPKLGAKFEPRFGRAAAFVIVDTDTSAPQAVANPAAQLGGGAGIRAAEFLIRQGVEAVISGSFGPKACDVLHPSGVRLYQAQSGTVDDLVAKLLNGDLDQVEGD